MQVHTILHGIINRGYVTSLYYNMLRKMFAKMSDIEIVVNFHTLLCCHQDFRLFFEYDIKWVPKIFYFSRDVPCRSEDQPKVFFSLWLPMCKMPFT